MITISFKYKIASLEKAFNIIELIADNHPEMSMVEIGKQMDMQPGTVHRFLNTLKNSGYVEQNEETKKYYLTLNFIKIANKILYKNGWVSEIYPYLRMLLNKYSFSINLIGFTKDEVIFLKDFSGSSSKIPLNPTSGRSGSLPLYCSVAGKIFLTTLSEDKLNKKLDEIVYIPRAEKTITNKEQLLKEIKITKKRGYATSIDEYAQGYTLLGIPLKTKNQKIVGCISFVSTSNKANNLLNDKTISDIKNTLEQINID